MKRPGRTIRLDRIQGAVEFENVSFAYDTGKPVLREIDFKSAPGTVTAFVGPSGAGKSTIIGLIAAFYVPTAAACSSTASISRRSAWIPTAPNSVSCSRKLFSSTEPFEKT